jgi:hypothetical protein
MHAHLATGNIGNLVQYLHADHAAGADQLFGSVGLGRVTRRGIQQYVGVKKPPGIRLVSVELEVGGEAPAKGSKASASTLSYAFACSARMPPKTVCGVGGVSPLGTVA